MIVMVVMMKMSITIAIIITESGVLCKNIGFPGFSLSFLRLTAENQCYHMLLGFVVVLCLTFSDSGLIA